MKENKSEGKEPKVELKDRIVTLLDNNPHGLRSGKIASLLGVSKKEVNKVLYDNKKDFKQDFLSWKVKK